MGMTYVQKVLARACGKQSVAVGDVVEPQVHLAMSHENAALVINQFNLPAETVAALLDATKAMALTIDKRCN